MRFAPVALAILLLVGCTSAPPLGRAAPPARLPAPGRETDGEREQLMTRPHLSEDEFLRLVELANPEVRALGHALEAAQGRKRQAGLLPNPTVVSEVEEAPASGLRIEDGKRTMGLAWPLAVGGRLGAGVEAAERERLVLATRAEATLRELRREARQALYRYHAAQQLASLEEELRAIAADFHETVRSRRAEKTVLELDQIKTEVELASQELEKRTADAEVQEAAVEVRRILGDPGFDPMRVAIQPPALSALEESARYEGLAAARHPLLLAADREVEWIDALATLAEREAVPDVEVSATYGLSGAEEAAGGEEAPGRDDIVGLGVTVPLPLFHRNQGRIAELAALRRKAVIEREGVRQALLARVRKAVIALGLRIERFVKYRDRILPEATRAVEQAASLYKEGKILNLEVLDAQRVLARTRRELLLAQRDVAQGIAELESLTEE